MKPVSDRDTEFVGEASELGFTRIESSHSGFELYMSTEKQTRTSKNTAKQVLDDTCGFLSNDLIAKLDAFFKKAFRWGYSCDLRRLSVLWHEADEHLFHKMVNNKDQCIHQLLPPEKILPIKLRATNCIFALPQCHYNLYKRSFVLRYLFLMHIRFCM